MQVVFKHWPESISVAMTIRGKILAVLYITHVRQVSHFLCPEQLGFFPRIPQRWKQRAH